MVVGDYLRPFPPHGSEGIAVVGNGGRVPKVSPPSSGQIRGENLREDISTESPRTSPHVNLRVGSKVGAEGVGGGVLVGGAGVHDGVGPASGWWGCGPAWGLG